MKSTLFCDLDGTLIKTKSGKKYPIHSEDWAFIPQTIEGLKHFVSVYNYDIVIVTNQGGIGLGVLNEKVFIKKIEKICNSLENILNLSKNSISYKYASSVNIDNYYRKPNVGMALDYLVDNEKSLKGTIMFGKDESDEEFAKNAGITRYISILKLLSV